MEKFWLKHKVAIILAALGALFHAVYVVYVIVAIGNRGGDLHSWLFVDKFAIVDFP